MFDRFETAMLMAAITALFGAVGSAFGGQRGMPLAPGVAVASALERMHRHAQGRPLKAAEPHPETVRRTIVKPLSGGGLRGPFAAHPPTAERVDRLLRMADAGAARWATREGRAVIRRGASRCR